MALEVGFGKSGERAAGEWVIGKNKVGTHPATPTTPPHPTTEPLPPQRGGSFASLSFPSHTSHVFFHTPSFPSLMWQIGSLFYVQRYTIHIVQCRRKSSCHLVTHDSKDAWLVQVGLCTAKLRKRVLYSYV